MPELRISAISIVRVVFAKEMADARRAEIFALPDSKQTDVDLRVRKELIYTYVVFYKYDPEHCFSAILSLCKNDHELSFHILGLLHLPELHEEHYLQLLNFLSDSEEKTKIDHVLMSFHDWAKKELVEAELNVVFKALKRFSFFGIGSIKKP
jgi:hypothetical protein